MTLSSELESFTHSVRNKVDHRLEDILKTDRHPAVLTGAMQYSTVGGGKRIRPLLCFASATLFDKNALDNPAVLAAACAVELIHAYSLVHDDLPAMDDDDLRRGQPTTHKQFDEATAILAGDALQALAFEVMAGAADTDPVAIIQCVEVLSRAGGKTGMVGGQMIDIESVGKSLTLEELVEMHSMKTGALIGASIQLGALAGGCESPLQMNALTSYAGSVGLAFQIQDDILDCTSSTEVLGKPQGADAELGKPTYVSLLGLKGAREKLEAAHYDACESLTNFGKNTLLSQIADYIVGRTH